MLLERISKIAESMDSRGLMKDIKLIESEDELMWVVKILIKLSIDTIILKQIIKHAVAINASNVIVFILKMHEEFTLNDVLEFITKIQYAHLIFDLNAAGSAFNMTINEISSSNDTYKKYRCERFAIFRMAGMSPNVAHRVNEWLF